jgi:hypothetical protein
MFVWGAKSQVADLGPQGSRNCPTCEKERPFHLVLQYTVRHFWYVFRWVTGKQYAEVCHVCQRGDMLDAKLVESRLAKSPIPFGARWSWAFLVGLLGIALVFDVIGTSSRNTSREAYLAAPLAGDRYVVNVANLLKKPQSETLYGVLRVRAVNGSSVEFDAPTYFYPRASGPEKDIRDGKLDEPGYFSPAPIVLSKEQIARMHQEHAIYSIERY